MIVCLMLTNIISLFETSTNQGAKERLSDLQKWIKNEMTMDIEALLLKHKERAKHYIRLASSGDVILRQNDLTAKQKVLIYLIGKLYSKLAGYSDKETVTNKEIEQALGLKEGTVKFNLFALRNEGLIVSNENGIHQIRITNLDTAFTTYLGGEKAIE